MFDERVRCRLVLPWKGSARLRVVQPVKGTSRFRQEWMFGFRFFGLRRKLQHDRALAFAKMREQHDLSVGKFQRIMVRARLVHVHLPEFGRPGEAAAWSS